MDEAVVDSGGCEGRSRLLEYNEGAVALFVLSQLMLGVALSPTSSLTMTYMDDNARDQSPKYFGTTTFCNSLNLLRPPVRPLQRNITHRCRLAFGRVHATQPPKF